VDNDHATIVKKIEQEVNVLRRGPIERQLIKKIDCFRKCNIQVFPIKNPF
jgi:hypothetical protein